MWYKLTVGLNGTQNEEITYKSLVDRDIAYIDNKLNHVRSDFLSKIEDSNTSERTLVSKCFEIAKTCVYALAVLKIEKIFYGIDLYITDNGTTVSGYCGNSQWYMITYTEGSYHIYYKNNSDLYLLISFPESDTGMVYYDMIFPAPTELCSLVNYAMSNLNDSTKYTII